MIQSKTHILLTGSDGFLGFNLADTLMLDYRLVDVRAMDIQNYLGMAIDQPRLLLKHLFF
jgi:hypothetical protein